MSLYPDHSPYYEQTLRIKNASNPRVPGSVILNHPSNFNEDYQLKIAYRKYRNTKSIPPESKRINFLFLHGNGMNKSIWHYHIDKLYTQYALNFPDLYIDTIIAGDHVNMGDSCYINKSKLGHIGDWNDFANDYILICKLYEQEAFLNPNAFNVVVGHSMSGFITLRMLNNEPDLFHCSILLNPIIFSSENIEQFMVSRQQDWYRKGYIKYNFSDIKQGENWYELIYQHYTNKSFYKHFDPIILRNMIEDEIPSRYKRSRYYNEVDLKHDGLYDYVNYSFSIKDPAFKYNKIKVATKVLVGDKDMNSRLLIDQTPVQLSFAKLQVLPGQYHNMHAQSPDLLVSAINEFVLETYNTYKKENDWEYKKKYGADYKQILFKKKMGSFLNDDNLPNKL